MMCVLFPARLLQLAMKLAKDKKLFLTQWRQLKALAARSCVLISIFSCCMLIGLFFEYYARLNLSKNDQLYGAYTCIGISFIYCTIIVSFPLVIHMQSIFDVIMGIKETRSKRRRRSSSLDKCKAAIKGLIPNHNSPRNLLRDKKSPNPIFEAKKSPNHFTKPTKKTETSGSVYFW